MRHTLYEDSIKPYTWIVDLNALHVVVVCVVLIKHVACDVWNVLSSIRFSGQIDLSASQVECGHEVLPEASKIATNVDLACDVRWIIVPERRETSSDRLVYPDHIREVRP